MAGHRTAALGHLSYDAGFELPSEPAGTASFTSRACAWHSAKRNSRTLRQRVIAEGRARQLDHSIPSDRFRRSAEARDATDGLPLAVPERTFALRPSDRKVCPQADARLNRNRRRHGVGTVIRWQAYTEVLPEVTQTGALALS